MLIYRPLSYPLITLYIIIHSTFIKTYILVKTRVNRTYKIKYFLYIRYNNTSVNIILFYRCYSMINVCFFFDVVCYKCMSLFASKHLASPKKTLHIPSFSVKFQNHFGKEMAGIKWYPLQDYKTPLEAPIGV